MALCIISYIQLPEPQTLIYIFVLHPKSKRMLKHHDRFQKLSRFKVKFGEFRRVVKLPCEGLLPTVMSYYISYSLKLCHIFCDALYGLSNISLKFLISHNSGVLSFGQPTVRLVRLGGPLKIPHSDTHQIYKPYSSNRSINQS